MTPDPEAALTAFGFTQLEALVYCELLREAPATGYRLAQRIGRVPANVYQALKALLRRGAILIESDAGEAMSYTPVPPAQLLAALRSGFEQNADMALQALATVQRPPRQETLSQLRTAAQVVERARSMLDGACETVLFDMMPEVYDLLLPDLDGARRRGVAVGGIAYRDADAGPTMPRKGEPSDAVGKRWPGLGMILVVDARELLIAQVSRDMTQVLNAVYSDGAFMGCLVHGLLQADLRLVALRGAGDTAVPESPLDVLALQSARPPGLRTLLGG